MGESKLKLRGVAEPAIVGRSKELHELDLALKAVKEGNGCTVLIAGEAGSGKTRIATEFLNAAKAQNVTVLSGWCLSNAAIPYFPFLEAFNSYVSTASNQSLGSELLSVRSSLMSNTSVGAEALNPLTWKDQTFSAVARELLEISTQKPLVLFIDDIHWADSASLLLLQYLSRLVGSEKILLLATYRTEEVYCILEGQKNPLKETLRLMARDNLFQEIRLQNLNQADVGLVIESMLGGRVHPSFTEKLASDSQGLPLFVVESIRMLQEEQKIVTDGQQWHLNDSNLCLPAKIKEIIHRRVESLDGMQRRVLDVGAVLGEQFDPKLVASVVARDSIDVLNWLNSMAMSTVLVRCENDSYWFNHAKYREMLYEEIPALLRKEYHLRIAQKIEDASKLSKGLPVNDLAYHYMKAGDLEKSLKYAILAGNNALAKFSNNEAIDYFTYALNISATDTSLSTIRISAIEGLGEAYFGLGQFDQAISLFEQLAQSAEGKSKLRAYRRAMDSAFFTGEFTKLLALTKEAEEYSSFDRLENARILMNRARAIMFLGNIKFGLADFEAALHVFEEENSVPDIARVLLGLGGASNRQWQLEKGLANSLRALLYFQELGDLRGLADAYNRAGQSFGYRLLNSEALAMNEQAVRLAEKVGNYSRAAEACVSMAWTYEILDQQNDALAASLKALEFAKRTSSQWSIAMVYANLVVEYSNVGNVELAEQYFSMLTVMPKEILSNGFVRFGACKAAISLARKQWSQAIEQLQDNLAQLDHGLNHSAEIVIRRNYAKALSALGLPLQAQQQRVEAEKLRRIRRAFQHSQLYPFFLASRQVGFKDKLAVRLDLINVSSQTIEIVSIEGLTPKYLKITNMPNCCSREDDGIIVHPKSLGPFKSVSVKLEYEPEKAGFFTFYPQIRYYDEQKIVKKSDLNAYVVSVIPPTGERKEITDADTSIEFGSSAAESAFQYLVRSFNNDLRQKTSVDKAGWRTLMDIARNTKVTKHSLYEFSHSRGKPLSELERLGLVESKYFLGERGRGGRVQKVRVVADNEAVRAHLRFKR